MTVYENLELGMYRCTDKARVRERIGLITHQGSSADLMADPNVRRAFLGAR